MEISLDLLSVTGFLVNAKAKFGDLTKIVYNLLDGSEEKIAYVLDSLGTFLNSKNYIEDDIPKPELRKYFEELSLILIVNSEFSKPFTIEEYAHLTYNVPKISKYLLTRIILRFNMTEYFCSSVEKLPLVYSCELFTEFLPCLDKVKLQQRLKNIYFILEVTAAIILKNQDSKYSDEMDTLLRTTPEFFRRFSHVPVDQLPKLKKVTLYKQAGYALARLFNLLLYCYKTNILSGIFIDQLIDATITVLQGVSLDMFIFWAEIDLDSGQTLQSDIAENAYVIVEKYQTFKPASKMVQLLKPFASKPKSFKEQLQSADIDKIVFMVNKQDDNQKQWFDALIFSPFFSNDKAVECVSKWRNLCKEEDVSRVLNLSLKVNHKEGRKLAIKCASILNLEQLIVVVTRHFYNNGFIVLNNDIQTDIVLLFNMLRESESVPDKVVFDLLLLMLQDPEASICFVIAECLKSGFYISVLKDYFSNLVDVLKIHDITLNCFQKVMKTSPPTTQNSENYVKLLQLFLDISLLTNDTLVLKIVNPSITEFLQHDNMEELKQILKILNILKISIQVKESMEPFFKNLFHILGLRTQFINHSSSPQSSVREVVNLIDNKIHRNIQTDLGTLAESLEDDKFILYYKKYVRDSDSHGTLLNHLFDDFNIENRTKAACHLMQILPSCVLEEWISICSEITQKSSYNVFLTTINDMMILLCEFTQNQENSENYFTLLEALKYCIQHLGIVIQNAILSIEDEICVTEELIRLLCYIPPALKETEGLNLLNLMSERSLKELGKNKVFVTKICRIKNAKVCQVLAQRILG